VAEQEAVVAAEAELPEMCKNPSCWPKQPAALQKDIWKILVP
jgi:hypothetical protein